ELIKDEPAIKEWLKRYKKRFGRNGNAFVLGGYQTIQLLSDVLRRANTLTDKEKIRETMAKTNLNDTLLGYSAEPYFDENGQAHIYLGVVQYQNGKRVPVYRQKK
ncbi:MAG: ABC transporter substrate-binding protein, partial [Desulfobacteraceae bacterium]|nr:ABC transporter substrate-binding protein [Desulfobacteraceae bacterium]